MKGGPVTIRRRCTGQCKKGRRCLEHLRFDMMWRGTRLSRAPSTSMRSRGWDPGQAAADSVKWKRRGIGSGDSSARLEAGLDPQRPPSPPEAEREGRD